MPGYTCKRCGARALKKHHLFRHFWDEHQQFVLRRMFYAGILGAFIGTGLLLAVGELGGF